MTGLSRQKARGAVCVLLVAHLFACAPRSQTVVRQRTVTVVVAGDERAVRTVGDSVEHADDLHVHVRRVELPSHAPEIPAFDNISSALARARREYIDADFAACLQNVPDDSGVNDLLGAGRRDLAGRVLFWRAACQVGAGNAAEAARSAHRLAVYGLDAPPDVEAAAPEVEASIAAAQREVASGPRTELRLSTASPTATFAVDGRVAACNSPCAIDVPQGDHFVRVESEGDAPVVMVLRAEGDRLERTVTTNAATPEVAGEQWLRRYAGTPGIDASGSLRLLGQSLRAPDLVLFAVAPGGRGLDLRAAYAVDGAVRARGERNSSPSALGNDSHALLRDLLVRSGTVVEQPLYRSPVFWSIVIGASLAATVVTAIFAVPPPVTTRISF